MQKANVEPSSKRPATAREQGIMCGFPPPPDKQPTLENWDLPPFNRWSFQNIRGLFPTTDVIRGTGAARHFDRDLQDLNGLTFKGADGSVKTVADWLTESYTDGFLVAHRGRVVLEHYFNDMAPETPHLSQSVAKSLVGVLIGVLHDEGLLPLDVPLMEFVPELVDCGYSRTTLSQVLDMQSGVRFVEDYGVPYSDMTRIDIASGWRPPQGDRPVSSIRDVILTLPQEREHGLSFSYRSIETDVLAWVAERRTGVPLARLLSDRIWSRIGAEHNGFFTVDRAGTALADGGFNATLRDYARFGQMMLDGGRAGGRQVVPASWVAACRDGETHKFGKPYSNVAPQGAYSRQWWVHDVRRGNYMARGVFGQLIHVDPEAEVLIVKLSSWPDYLIENFTRDALAAAIAIRQALSER
jgi:CubicO group peptidase (beta-lactamase class C family)